MENGWSPAHIRGMLAIIERVLAVLVFAATAFVIASVVSYMAYYGSGLVTPSPHEVRSLARNAAIVTGVLLAIVLLVKKLRESK